MPSGAGAPGECRRTEPPPATALEECCLHSRPGVSFPPRPGPDALGPSCSGNSQTPRLLRRLTPAPRAPGVTSPVRPLGPRGPGCPHPPAATACPPSGPKGAAWDSPLLARQRLPPGVLGDTRQGAKARCVRHRVEGSRRRGGGGREGGGQAWLEATVALESSDVPRRSVSRWIRPPVKGGDAGSSGHLARLGSPRCGPASLRGGLGHRVP